MEVGFMKYIVEMGSVAMIHIPSFINTGSGIQKQLWADTQTHKGSWGLAHPMSLTELALLDGRRPLPLGDVIGLTLNFKL
jgi:hypothetical protein